jgi:hypothetical protein
MASEPEAGSVTAEQARLLLMLDSAAELKRLERDGAVAQIAPGRYWLKDLVQGYIRFMREHRHDTETNVLAACWGLSQQRISQLANMGWIKPLAGMKGKYNWIEACSGFVRFLRDEDRRSTKSAADSRMRDAKAHDIEVRTKQRLNRLVPIEIYDEMIDSMAGVVRSEFAGLAATCTRDLTMRRIIEREVNARLRRIAEHAMAQALRLEALGGADHAIGSDRAGPVGSGKPDLPANGGGAGAA